MEINQNIEYDLIPVIQSEINGESIPTANARELHEFLEVGKDFSNWIKSRISQYNFEEKQDFIIIRQNGRKLGRPEIQYHITLDMAKELSMVERNEKGKQARQYFIECERKVKEPQDFHTVLNNPSAMRGLLLSYTEKVLALEEKNKALTADSVAFNRIAVQTEGAVCLRIAAKLLQMPEKKFLQFANAKGFIFRNHCSKIWQGYSDKAKKGLVELKYTTIERDDGSTKTVEQVLITRAGIAKLAELMEAV